MTRLLSHEGPPTIVTLAESPTVRDVLARAVTDGIVSRDQADRILLLAGSEESARAPAGRLRAHVAEALGYVGAALVAIAALVTVQQFWADMTAGAHTALLAVVAVVLLVAGAFLHAEAGTPIGRLGSFLWLLGVAATAGTAATFAEDVLELEEAALGVATTAPPTVVAFALWSLRQRSLQQLAVLVGLAATSATLLALVDVTLEDWGGLMVWTLGLVWIVLARLDVVQPRRTGLFAGAVATLLGPLLMFGSSQRVGIVLGIATAATLVAASVLWRQTVLLGLGVLGLFVFVPTGVFEFFGDDLGAPVALMLSGLLLLGVALAVARMRIRDDEGGQR